MSLRPFLPTQIDMASPFLHFPAPRTGNDTLDLLFSLPERQEEQEEGPAADQQRVHAARPLGAALPQQGRVRKKTLRACKEPFRLA